MTRGNTARVVFPDKVRELRVEVDLVAELAVYNPFDFFLEPHAEQFPFVYSDEQARELFPYLRMEPLSPRFTGYLGAVSRQSRPTLDFLVELNQRVQRDVAYVIRFEEGVQSKEETLASARSCATRPGSSYSSCATGLRRASSRLSHQLVPDVKALDGRPSREGLHDLHAGSRSTCPGREDRPRRDLGLLAGEGHIPSPHAGPGAAPHHRRGGAERVVFEHAMSVARVHESPRVTKPYTGPMADDPEPRPHATAISSAGTCGSPWGRADFRLRRGSGRRRVEYDRTRPAKRGLAATLLRRLRKHYGANGFVHSARQCIRRAAPSWRSAPTGRERGADLARRSLVADEQVAGATARRRSALHPGARRQARVAATHVQAGYEDVWYYLWRERRLPINVDPFDARIEDEMERDRLRAFQPGARPDRGLPCARARRHRAALRTGAWGCGRPHVPLPGRLPDGLSPALDSLPGRGGDIPSDPQTRTHCSRLSPRTTRCAPRRAHRLHARPTDAVGAAPPSRRPPSPCPPPLGPPATVRVGGRDRPHRALRRAARRHAVRLQPPCRARDYLELVAAVEATSAALSTACSSRAIRRRAIRASRL